MNRVVWSERLYLWVKAHNFPAPYSEADLGYKKYEVLAWLGHNLVIPRIVGSFQLCLVGPSESQKTLYIYIYMVSAFLRVYFAPAKLDNLTGAEACKDLWVIEGCSSVVFNEDWSKSASAVLFSQLLDGQTVTLSWGPNREFSFLKDRNIPSLSGKNKLSCWVAAFLSPSYCKKG